MYDTDDYVLDLLMHYQITHSHCLASKDTADFIYIPYFFGQANERWESAHNFWSLPRQKQKKRLDYRLWEILRPYKTLNKPMIFITPFQLNHEGVIDDGLPNFLYDYPNVVVLSVGSQDGNLTEAPDGSLSQYKAHRGHRFTVPYPTAFHFTPGITESINSTRDILVMMAFRIRENMKSVGAASSHRLRKSLKQQCENSPSDCSHLGITNHQIPNITDAMSRSVFCIQPTGDTLLRKGFTDSVILGCIPVVFYEEQIDLYRFFDPIIDRYTVTIPLNRHGDMIQYLKEMWTEKRSEVKGKQSRLDEIRNRYKWNYQLHSLRAIDCSHNVCDATETIFYQMHSANI